MPLQINTNPQPGDWTPLMNSQVTAPANQNALTAGQAQQAQTAAQLNQANTGFVQAQTQGTQLANQTSALSLALYKQGLNGMQLPPNAAAAATGVSSGADETGNPTNYFDTPGVTAGLVKRYANDPNGTPEMAAAVNKASGLPAGPLRDAILGQALSIQKQYVTSNGYKLQQEASALYNQMDSVVTGAEKGISPYASMVSANPAAAAQIAATTDDPQMRDAAALEIANTVGSTVHMYTGRKAELNPKDGTYRDEQTGRPVIGVPQAGLSTQEWLAAAADAYSLVPVTNADESVHQVQKYLVPGAPGGGDAKAYVKALLFNKTGAKPLSPTLPPQSAPAQQANVAAQTALNHVQKHPGSNPGVPPTTGDPKMDAFLRDPQYQTANAKDLPKNSSMQTANFQQQGAVAAYQDAQKNMPVETQKLIGSQSDALTLYKNAQEILAKGSFDPGIYASVLQKAKQYTGTFQGSVGDYQQVVKYLSNAALAASQAGTSTDAARQLSLEELSPNTAQTPAALNHLVAQGIAQAQYKRNVGNVYQTYASHGGDPRYFYAAYAKHFPMEDVANTNAKTMPTGPKLQAYAAKYKQFGGDTAKATAYLQSQDYK